MVVYVISVMAVTIWAAERRCFYEPYINGEKELRELNEEYRSNTGS